VAVYHKTTAKDVTNTLTETDLLNAEITIPGGTIGTTGVVRAVLLGDYLNNGASEAPPDLRVKLGGTELWHAAAANQSVLNSNASRRPFYMEFLIHNLGAENSQYLAGFVFLGSPGGTAGLGGGLDIAGAVLGDGGSFSSSGASSVDTSASCALLVTAQFANATTTRSLRLQAAVVTVLA
jgi:hypothetical protein